MIDLIYIICALIIVVLPSIGTSIGQGMIGKKALEALNVQPSATNLIVKFSIIGMAITETAAIMGLVITILMLGDSNIASNDFNYLAAIGMAFAMGISGMCAGIASALPAVGTCHSLMRQPFMQAKLLNLMLITQTLIMTPNMFGMLITLLIKSKIGHIASLTQGLQLLASGLSIGIGCIGPSIGLSLFAFAATNAAAINKKAFGKVMTFTFICQAIIETPVIFSLLISLMILNTQVIDTSLLQGWQFIAAALCIGLSTIAPGINSGKTGAAACRQIALHLEQYGSISKLTLLALALLDSFAVYGLLISIIMLLFKG